MQLSISETEVQLHMNEKQMLRKIARILRDKDLITPEEEAAMLEQIRLEG